MWQTWGHNAKYMQDMVGCFIVLYYTGANSSSLEMYNVVCTAVETPAADTGAPQDLKVKSSITNWFSPNNIHKTLFCNSNNNYQNIY